VKEGTIDYWKLMGEAVMVLSAGKGLFHEVGICSLEPASVQNPSSERRVRHWGLASPKQPQRPASPHWCHCKQRPGSVGSETHLSCFQNALQKSGTTKDLEWKAAGEPYLYSILAVVGSRENHLWFQIRNCKSQRGGYPLMSAGACVIRDCGLSAPQSLTIFDRLTRRRQIGGLSRKQPGKSYAFTGEEAFELTFSER